VNATLCYSPIIVPRLYKILFTGFFLALLTILAINQAVLAGQGKPTRAYQVYVVKKGDTLDKVARRFDVTIRAIRRANHLKSVHLRPGQRLKIPITKTFVAGGKTCSNTYRVQQGDTLRSIARRCGISIAQLRTFNHLDGTNRLRVGQVLRIPSKNHSRRHEYLPVPGR